MNSHVYIMANTYNTVLYVGVTSNLAKRVWEHKSGENKDCFTFIYNCHKLVYCEEYSDIRDAIRREKQLKNWKREWKNALVNKVNPSWNELPLN